jgi:hypothetical protein
VDTAIPTPVVASYQGLHRGKQEMILDKLKNLAPEWIEAGSMILTLVIGAILSAGITFYKVDVMSDDVKEIKTSVSAIPVLVQRVETIEKRIESAEEDLEKLEDRLYRMQEEK